jgi:hypothetical protein
LRDYDIFGFYVSKSFLHKPCVSKGKACAEAGRRVKGWKMELRLGIS